MIKHEDYAFSGTPVTDTKLRKRELGAGIAIAARVQCTSAAYDLNAVRRRERECGEHAERS
jgi:hypothetical protein